MRRATRSVLPLLLLGFGLHQFAPAQGLEYVKAHYTKYEYRIPMRDGVRLFTAVYVPKDQTQSYPILLTRTPYSVRPYGVDQYRGGLGPSAQFGEEGYIFVYQDVRGRWMSEGQFVNMRPYIPEKKGPADIDESSDAWDTIDWLVKHVPNHNGRVGMVGISYPGFYTAAAVIDAHPALRAASPQAPVTDWFVGDDWHHHGAFFLTHMFNFMARFGYARPEPTKTFDRSFHTFDHGTPDGYQFFLRLGPLPNANREYFKDKLAFWNEVMRHATYDSFWQARNLRRHLKNIRPNVMTVGGWFDAENLFGALETYKKIEGGRPSGSNTLVMGPWRHGGWSRGQGSSLGHVQFNAKTSEFFQEKIEFPFFQRYLKDKGDFTPPEAWVFETGTNQWRQYEHWPPRQAEARSLYLHPGGQLSLEPPTGEASTDAFAQYVSDPARPVPFINKITTEMDVEYMVADQRFAGRRPDVLTFQSEVLEQDLTICGSIEANLHVSTSGTDSDWIVKLIDVYPDDYPDPKKNPIQVRMGGFQQLVRGDVFRARFRDSCEQPKAMEPNRPTPIHFRLQDISHAFRSGHRIMVQIQSSWFPLVDRNPQTFVDIYHAKRSDFQVATQRVYYSADKPSHLQVRVLP